MQFCKIIICSRLVDQNIYFVSQLWIFMDRFMNGSNNLFYCEYCFRIYFVCFLLSINDFGLICEISPLAS